MLRGASVAIAAAFLIAPSFAEASAGPHVSGDVSFLSDVFLRGPARVSADQGILSLAADHVAPKATVTWEHADVLAYHNQWNYMDTPFPQPAERVRYHADSWIENFTIGAARLDDFRCEDGCRFYVTALPNAPGTLAASGDANGALRWRAEPKEYSAGSADHADHGWQYYTEKGWLRAGNLATAYDTLDLDGASATASGDLWLVLSNGSAVVTTLADGRTRTLDSSSAERPLLGYLSGGGPMQRDHVFYALHVQGASLVTRPGTTFTLDAPSARFDIDGTLSALWATGTLQGDGETYPLSDEPILATGAFALIAHVVHDEALLPDAAPHVQGRLASDSGTLVARGFVLAPPPLLTPARSAELGAVAVLIALAGRALHLAYFAGYSRITRADVLANENRRRIFEAIRGAPGLTLTETARRLGLARVVALHHVRMLVDHRFIVERSVGGRRFYYLAESAPAPEDATAATVLIDATRRRIAEAIRAAAAPPTQRELVERTGVPQRLISYHLGKLVAGGLVQAEGRLPRRYRWQ